MCWTRETGVVPAALVGLLLVSKAPEAHLIASVTFVTIPMTILIQAPSTEWVGRRLTTNAAEAMSSVEEGARELLISTEQDVR